MRPLLRVYFLRPSRHADMPYINLNINPAPTLEHASILAPGEPVGFRLSWSFSSTSPPGQGGASIVGLPSSGRRTSMSGALAGRRHSGLWGRR